MQNRRKLQTIPCLRLESWQTMHSTSKSQSPTMPSPTHVTCRSFPASSGIHVRNIQKHHMAELTKGRQNNWSLVKNHNPMLHDQISASTSRQAERWLILVQSKYFSPLMGHFLVPVSTFEAIDAPLQHQREQLRFRPLLDAKLRFRGSKQVKPSSLQKIHCWNGVQYNHTSRIPHDNTVWSSIRLTLIHLV